MKNEEREKEKERQKKIEEIATMEKSNSEESSKAFKK
jgi:hypothetical protein